LPQKSQYLVIYENEVKHFKTKRYTARSQCCAVSQFQAEFGNLNIVEAFEI
jgi:hypothetical protein